MQGSWESVSTPQDLIDHEEIGQLLTHSSTAVGCRIGCWFHFGANAANLPKIPQVAHGGGRGIRDDIPRRSSEYAQYLSVSSQHGLLFLFRLRARVYDRGHLRDCTNDYA